MKRPSCSRFDATIRRGADAWPIARKSWKRTTTIATSDANSQP